MSSSRGKPPAVASLFEGVGRKKLICPECEEVFTGPWKAWDHAKTSHKEIYKSWTTKEEEEIEKARYIERAQKPPKASDPPHSSGRLPNTQDEEEKGNVGSTLLEDTQASSVQIETKTSEQASRNLEFNRATSNPLKRERGPGSELPDPASRPAVEPFPAKLSKGEDFESQRKELDEYKRSPAVKQLFDPDLDVASQRVKSRGQSGISGHRHSKEPRARMRRRALSDGGERSTRPQHSDRNLPGSNILPPVQPTILTRDSDSTSFRPQTPESDTQEGQDDNEPTKMLRQPETRSISHEQLVIEVKGIYAGLVMVEGKCIDVDEKQSHLALEPSRREPLKNDQWQSLIALHKQLLHEHHDFFLASQHPAASFNLSKLAAKYSMPARMWRHGIHAFLEVLRHRLPESLEHMLAFIYIAYSMMALLYETVPAFEDTWIECLGDLGRYRMAIEDDEPKDREVWSGVARFWYSKASSKNPTVGRLYHHLAILAKPFTLEQLSFYTRSLTCVTPFESARGSILTLFNPILTGRETTYYRFSSMEPMIIKLHGLLFLYPKGLKEELDQAIAPLKANQGAVIYEAIEKFGIRFKRVGVNLVVSNIAALFEFGAMTSKGTHRAALRRAYDYKNKTTDLTRPTSNEINPTNSKPDITTSEKPDVLTAEEIEISEVVRFYAADITFFTFEIALAKSNWARNHTLPMVLVHFIFIWSGSLIPGVIDPLEEAIPWEAMCLYLNHLKIDSSWKNRVGNPAVFPSPTGISGRPPPELYIIQGQVYTQQILPKSLFEDARVDDEERMLEIPSHDPYRILTVLWLAARIASLNRWIKYDKETEKFMDIRAAKKDLTGNTQAPKSSVKIESTDEDLPMEDYPRTASKDEDAMSDVITEEKPIKRETGLSDVTDETPNFSSSPTTRTNTDRTNNTNVTVATTVHPEAPLTPLAREMGADEPEEPPMKDISPGKEPTSPKLIKVEGTPWLPNPVVDPGSSPPRKNSAENGSDNAVRIVEDHEDPEGGGP